MSRQTKITKAARGRDCTVRLPGCPNDTETTVLAHYRLAGTCGMGIKPNHIQGAWADDFCHSCIDGRIKHPDGLTHEEMRLYHAEGVFRTNDTLIAEGVISL